MNAKSLVELVNEFNSRADELFDHCADLFISKVRKELEEIYNSGNWTKMLSCTQIGISVEYISPNFQEFRINILSAYPMRFNTNVHDEFDFPTFQEFIEDEDYKNFELCGFQNEDIILIKPFYQALKGKGFECYVDSANYQLVVTLDINQSSKRPR